VKKWGCDLARVMPFPFLLPGKGTLHAFYVDETGHTGPNLFDRTQPVLSYGVLSSPDDLDKVAETELASLRKKLGVQRLHAAELGMYRLDEVVDTLLVLQKKHRIRFDVWQVVKRDHAIISFFDQVFDQGLNPVVPWTAYWTPCGTRCC
jgi:hypothetical protein